MNLLAPDVYLRRVLYRERVNTDLDSPVRRGLGILVPHLKAWGGRYVLKIVPSGSFAKGTANHSGTDIDLLISLHSETPHTLEEIYEKLFERMQELGLQPKRRNVAIGVKVLGYNVDLVPARHQGAISGDHSLWLNRKHSWQKTNIAKHVITVRRSQLQQEMRILKLWRDQHGLDFPSFYLELTTIDAIGIYRTGPADNVDRVFAYLANNFVNARVVDPANTNNVISDDLTQAEKAKIKAAAGRALAAQYWSEVVT